LFIFLIVAHGQSVVYALLDGTFRVAGGHKLWTVTQYEAKLIPVVQRLHSPQVSLCSLENAFPLASIFRTIKKLL
jgi:hypothetical protein